MSQEASRPIGLERPAVYRIEVQGALDASWENTFGQLHVEHGLDGHGVVITTLMGEVPDQAALVGVLNLAYSLGMPLLSVDCLSRT